MPYFTLLSALLIVATPFSGSQAFDLSGRSPDTAILMFDNEAGGDWGYEDGGAADLDDPDGDGDDENAHAPEDDDDGWDADDDVYRTLRT